MPLNASGQPRNLSGMPTLSCLTSTRRRKGMGTVQRSRDETMWVSYEYMRTKSQTNICDSNSPGSEEWSEVENIQKRQRTREVYVCGALNHNHQSGHRSRCALPSSSGASFSFIHRSGI